MTEPVTCPRCDHQGTLEALRIRRLDRVVQVCDECEALWFRQVREEPKYGLDFIDFGIFLRENEIPYDPSEWDAVSSPPPHPA